MANRFPLIIDGNQIKELPDEDNLYLRNNNIAEVKNITALGSIEAAEFLVQGKRIQSRNFLELDDTPATFQDSEKYIVRVNEQGTGLEFADFQSLGEINFDAISAGSVRGDFIGSLFTNDSTLIVDGENGTIPYSVLTGTPTNLSEFNNDLTSLTVDQITLQDGIVEGDLKGSVFADNSTTMIDGINGIVLGPSVGSVYDSNNSILILDTENVVGYFDIVSRDGNNTLLVDAENGTIPWSVIDGAPSFEDGSNSLTLQSLTVGNITIENNVITGDVSGDLTGNVIGNIYASDETTVVLDNGDGTIINKAVFTGNVTGDVTGDIDGDLTGDVYASDGTTKVLESGDGSTTPAELTGNVVGNVTGDVFASDGTTLIVDAANGGVPWEVILGTPVLDVEIAGGVTVPVDNNFDIQVEDSVSGTNTFRITPDGEVQIPNTLTTFGTDTNLSIQSNGSGFLNLTDGQNGFFLDGTTQALSIASTGGVTIQGAASSSLNLGTGTTGTVTIGNGSNTVDFPNGTNIDFTGTNIIGNTVNITEEDPVFTASPAAGITSQNITDWNNAANYTESDTLDSVTGRGNTTTNSITVGGISTESLTVTGSGSSTIQSGNDIVLEATNRTRIEGTPFRVAQMTTTERNAIGSPQNGDIVYNTTESKFQVRQNGSWNNLTTEGSLQIANYNVTDFTGVGSTTIATGDLLVDDSSQDIEISVSVSSFTRMEITISGMIYYGGATGIPDRTMDIERSINGGAYSVIGTAIGSPQGPTHITFVDTHGGQNGDILVYRLRNTSVSTDLSVDFTKANQIIIREV